MGKKLSIFHNIVAPYRVPLFNLLARKYRLQVNYFLQKDSKRLWKIDLDKQRYSYNFMPTTVRTISNKHLILCKDIKNTIRDFGPDVIISIDDPPNILSTYQVQRYAVQKGIPFILWTGNTPRDLSREPFIFRIIYAFLQCFRHYALYKNTNAFVAYGQFSRRYLIDHFAVAPEKIFIGTQGYPYELMPSDPDLITLKKENNILFVGSLLENKGLSVLIEAFKEICNDLNCRLILMGEGEDSNYVKNLTKGIERDRLILTGFLEGREKFAFFKKAKVLVLPSRYDCWGWVVNEALYMGIPVITSGKVMAKEMIDGNGIIVDEERQFADAIKYILSANDEQYSVMRAQARRKALQYDAKCAANCIDDAIEYLTE